MEVRFLTSFFVSKAFNPRDHYFKKAKDTGFRARSAFKLEEIQQRFHLLRPSQYVVDLGCAPGSFLQYASKILGKDGKIIGFDIKPVQDFGDPRIKTYVASVLEDDIVSIINGDLDHVDCIISDIAPNTSGIKDVDHGRSIVLNEAILAIALQVLKNRGSLLLKVFDGGHFPGFVKAVKAHFAEVKIVKPDASRDRSREVYVIGLQKRSEIRDQRSEIGEGEQSSVGIGDEYDDSSFVPQP